MEHTPTLDNVFSYLCEQWETAETESRQDAVCRALLICVAANGGPMEYRRGSLHVKMGTDEQELHMGQRFSEK